MQNSLRTIIPQNLTGSYYSSGAYIKTMEMKKLHLYLTIRVEVESKLVSLSKTIEELEQQTDYVIGSTENVKVVETEILQTDLPKS
jgi:hypothetical protein